MYRCSNEDVSPISLPFLLQLLQPQIQSQLKKDEMPAGTDTRTQAEDEQPQEKTVTLPVRPTKRSANDFRFGKTIGEGSFSTVYLAKDIHTGKEWASKCE